MWLKLTSSLTNRHIIFNTDDIKFIQSYEEGSKSLIVSKSNSPIKCNELVEEIWNAIYQKEPCVDLTNKTK